MPAAITPNLSGLTDKALQEAFLAGVASAEADFGFVRPFSWNGIDYKAVGHAPPSGCASTRAWPTRS